MEGVIATLRLLFARQAKGKRKLVLRRCFTNDPAPAAQTRTHGAEVPFLASWWGQLSIQDPKAQIVNW